jgi:hypothetical protein
VQPAGAGSGLKPQEPLIEQAVKASFSSEKFLAKMSHRMFRTMSEEVFGY